MAERPQCRRVRTAGSRPSYRGCVTLDESFPRAVAVVPMHNEAQIIGQVVAELRTAFPLVVCVDDGSKDDSAAAARAAGASVVSHPTNLGQGAALETGIRFALSLPETEYVVTFDADGQHDVGDARAMVQRAEQGGLQVVLGSRFLTSADHVPFARRLLLRGAVRFTRHTTGLALTDAHNGLRVLRRDAAEAIRLRLHGMSHASEVLTLLARGGFSVEEHPVTIRYTDYSRAKGQKSYNALNILFELAVNRMRAAA
jgi:glycosyltransferase involved in cell wall biosynthesis